MGAKKVVLGVVAALVVVGGGLGAWWYFAPPKTPRITPRSAEILGAGSDGLRMRIHLMARNENRFVVNVRSIDVDVTIAGRNLGRSAINNAVRLPPNQDVPLDGDVRVPLSDLPGLLLATAMNERVPYRLDGHARIGAERVQLNVPFRMESTMPRSVLLGAGPNSVPGLPPLPWRN